MAYVGRGINNISNASILDDITFTDSAGPYNLTQNSGADAFTPISVQALVIQVDGVIQDPTTYTISAATITFDSVMASSSTNNFIVHNGVGLIIEPADDAVTTAKIAALSVTAAKIATDAVETAKIKDLNVTAGKLAATQDLSTKTITLPASVAGLGTGITNAQLAGSITDAKITGLSSSKLTGALPAISGASLTSLNATNIGSGTVPTARLGTGTASSSVFLAGDNTWAEAGGGKLLQVLQATVTDTFSTSSASFVDITGLTIDITPAATSSKILAMAQISSANSDVTGSTQFFSLVRDSTEIFIGDTASSRARVTAGGSGSVPREIATNVITYLDSPSATSATTYKIQMRVSESHSTGYINRTSLDTDDSSRPRGTSSITVMEIGA